jgi:hypothetical protein
VGRDPVELIPRQTLEQEEDAELLGGQPDAGVDRDLAACVTEPASGTP